MVHGEKMTVESQPPCLRPGGARGLGGLGQRPAANQASARAPGTITRLTGSASPGIASPAAASRSTAANSSRQL